MNGKENLPQNKQNDQKWMNRFDMKGKNLNNLLQNDVLARQLLKRKAAGNFCERERSDPLDELSYLSAARMSEAIRKKELSPVEVMEHTIRRIEQRNPSLNAFVYTKFDYAMDQAKRLQEQLGAGKVSGGEFCGVPTALKDFLPGKPGWPGSSGGVRALAGAPDAAWSNYARSMEAQGAILVGKTNSPSFAFRGTCDNFLYGPTSTPFDLSRNSGGSSGGSAAAVADGLVPVAEGTDGGGSIRIPAAWCCCYGYKASVGTIPSVNRPNAYAESHPYCFAGAITRTVEDSAMTLNHMAYFDPRDPFSIEYPKRDFRDALKRNIKGMRIAYTLDFGVYAVEPEIAATAARAAQRFAEAGCSVEQVDFRLKRSHNELAECWDDMICINTVDVVESIKRAGVDLMGEHAGDLPEEMRRCIEKAYRGNYLDYARNDAIRTEVYDALQDVFDQYDLILSPTLACDPVPNAKDGNTMGPEYINGEKAERLIGFCLTYFCNFTGHPAASVPAGLSPAGLPVGLQIIGRRFHDADVLAASAAFEQIQPWYHLYERADKRPLLRP